MKANTSVVLTVNDKQYILKYDIKALLKLEQLISTKNIAKLVLNAPFSHGDTLMCLYIGLQAEQPSVTEKKAMQILENYLKDNPLYMLQDIVLLALTKAGAVGNTKSDADTETESEPGK